MKKCRNSSFELLKFISMVLIVIFHCYMTATTTSNAFYDVLPQGINFAELPKGGTKLLLLIAGYFGSTGNLIFIICSSWFLCESDRVQLKKVLSLLLTSFILSVTHIIIIHGLFPSVDLPGSYLYECFFPVSYASNWFITCYILLYLIHGGLNLIIKNMKHPLHFLVLIILLIMYCFIDLYARHNFFYNSHLIQFIVVYILTAYIKKYKNTGHCALMMIIFGMAGFAYLVIAKHFGFPPSVREVGLLNWAKNSNPFLIFFVSGIVMLVSMKTFHNKLVNYCSSLSLLLYLVHENKAFRHIVRPLIWHNINSALGAVSIPVRFFIFSFIILVYGLSLSMTFNELCMPWVGKLSEFLSGRLSAIFRSLSNRYLTESSGSGINDDKAY